MRPPGRSDGDIRVTVQDVAKVAAVSTATVSRVLTGADRVRSDRATRVRAAIEALGYVPNAAARALASQRSGLVGIEVSSLEQHAALVAKAIARLEQAGFATLVRQSGQGEESAPAPLAGLDLEGWMFVGRGPRTEVGPSKKGRRPPCVVCGADGEGATASVSVAVRQAAETVARFLVGHGHRRVGVVSGIASSPLGRRFTDEIRSAGMPLEVVALEIPAWAAALRAGRGGAGIARSAGPTALVCADDDVAAALIRTASTLGIHVPRDLSVIGWGDGPSAVRGAPTLTTVRVPVHALAIAAAELLLDLRAGEARQGHLLLPAKLVVRQTTGPVPE